MHRPSFRIALLLTQVPLVVFAVLIVGATLALLGLAEAQALRMEGRLEGGTLLAEDIRGALRTVEAAWLATLGAFLLVCLGASGTAVLVTRLVEGRCRALIGYMKDRSEGLTPRHLPRPRGEDALAELERAVMNVADRVAERERAQALLHERARFEGRLQRALGLADSEEDANAVVLRALREEAGGRGVALLLADSSDAHLRTVEEAGLPASRCPVGSPRQCAAVRLGQSLRFSSSEALDACPRLRGRGGAALSAACTPITVMGQTIGVIHLTGPDGEVPPESLVERMEGVAVHAGTRLSALRTLSTSELQAHTDVLTGLQNRRSFERRATERLRAAPRAADTVVMVDIDHFKRLNDSHGHEAGDRALRLFAGVLRASLRERDIVCRLGGEEFAIMLLDCSADEAVGVLESVALSLKEAITRSTSPRFTASFGLAETDAVSSLEELLARADARLYEAKQAGRDCIVGPQPGRLRSAVADLRLDVPA